MASSSRQSFRACCASFGLARRSALSMDDACFIFLSENTKKFAGKILYNEFSMLIVRIAVSSNRDRAGTRRNAPERSAAPATFDGIQKSLKQMRFSIFCFLNSIHYPDA